MNIKDRIDNLVQKSLDVVTSGKFITFFIILIIATTSIFANPYSEQKEVLGKFEYANISSTYSSQQISKPTNVLENTTKVTSKALQAITEYNFLPRRTKTEEISKINNQSKNSRVRSTEKNLIPTNNQKQLNGFAYKDEKLQVSAVSDKFPNGSVVEVYHKNKSVTVTIEGVRFLDSDTKIVLSTENFNKLSSGEERIKVTVKRVK